MELFSHFFEKTEIQLGRHTVRYLAGATCCLVLSACAVAPGMRMKGQPTLPVSSGDAQTPAVELQVPITDIDVALIKRMRAAAIQTTDVDVRSLFESPKGYSIGPGDVLQITVWDHPELAEALGPQPQANARAADPVAGFVVDHDGNLRFPYVGTIQVGGDTPEQVQVKLSKALAKPFLNPQVTVRIASFRSKQIYIDGEVHSPGTEAINDIPMTLYDAISRAGGFNSTADQSHITLVRDGKSYLINLSQMLDGGSNPAKILLKDGDLLRVISREENGAFVMGEVNRPMTALPLANGRLTLSDAISQAGSINSNSADAAQLYVIRSSFGSDPQVFHLNAASPISMLLANQFELQPKDVVYVDSNGLVRFSRVLNLLLPAINAGLTAAIVTK
ncbi:polysaccharide biosynthesis/export family protein [Paraburkholderia madseniana]|uniref:polysaccharide biosynthesis/export family protein n=1 Tax=Paraburkholderia madseniana TaxID=2599607 RepID=UPI0038B88B0C